jgi:hypothetical protein
VLIFCETCRTATLIQIFQPSDGPPPDPALLGSILSSFKDHGTDGSQPWRVYDINARLPGYFDLKTFQFQPGQFQLEFDGNGTSLALIRWSPAAILLADGDLKTFAVGQGLVAGRSGMARFTIGGQRVDWTLKSPSRTWPRFRKSSPSHQRGRLWHLEPQNRILGVVLAGKSPINRSEFNKVADAYGLVSS